MASSVYAQISVMLSRRVYQVWALFNVEGGGGAGASSSAMHLWMLNAGVINTDWPSQKQRTILLFIGPGEAQTTESCSCQLGLGLVTRAKSRASLQSCSCQQSEHQC